MAIHRWPLFPAPLLAVHARCSCLRSLLAFAFALATCIRVCARYSRSCSLFVFAARVCMVAHRDSACVSRNPSHAARVACRALRAAWRAARTLGLVVVLGLVYGSPGIQQMRKHYTSRMTMNCWDVSLII